MADYPSQNNTNTAPYYQPLTNDCNNSNNSTPYSKNNENQNPLQIQENQQNISKDKGNNTYTTPKDSCYYFCECIIYGLIFLGFIVSLTLFFIEFHPSCLGALFLSLIGFFIGLILPPNSYSINIDTYLGIITITVRKFFSCFNKKKKIRIIDIQQVIVESYFPYDESLGRSRVAFKLLDGKEVKGLEIDDESKKEGRNAFLMLRNNLPQNIPFGGNLAY